VVLDLCIGCGICEYNCSMKGVAAFRVLSTAEFPAHAKDLAQDGEAGQLAAGTGLLDYDHYLGLLQGFGFDGPLLLHSLAKSRVDRAVAFLRGRLQH
jgi:sugar phosphate isomerase/epimerase